MHDTKPRPTWHLEAGIAGVVLLQMASVWEKFSAMSGVAEGDTDGLLAATRTQGAMTVLFSVAGLAVALVWIVWQYRVLKDAKELFSAKLRRSPRWGAWSFLVPIVNLWVPQSSLKEALIGSAPSDVSAEERRAAVSTHTSWWAWWVGGLAVDWVAGGIATALASQVAFRGAFSIMLIVQIVSAIYAVMLVRLVSDWQGRRAGEALSEGVSVVD